MRLFRGWWDASVVRRLLGFALLLAVAALGLHIYYRFTTEWPTTWSIREEMSIVGTAGGGMLGAVLGAASMRLLGPLGTGLGQCGRRRRRVDIGRRQRSATVFRRAGSESGVHRRRTAGAGGQADPEAATPRESATSTAAAESAATEERFSQKRRGPRSPRMRARTGTRPQTGARPRPPREGDRFVMPSTSLLERPKHVRKNPQAMRKTQARQLEETLASFGVDGRVVSTSRGPTVTRYEVQPPPGIKVSRIVGLGRRHCTQFGRGGRAGGGAGARQIRRRHRSAEQRDEPGVFARNYRVATSFGR